MSRVGHVYVLHCLVNGKEYVGQTIRKPEERWQDHIKEAFKKKSQRPLYRAIRKYGLANFTAEVIWSGLESKLNAAERKFIRQRKTFIDNGWGYNLTTGGGQCKLSAQTRRCIAESVRIAWRLDFRNRSTDLHKQRLSELNATRKLNGVSTVTSNKMRRSRKAAWHREDYNGKVVRGIRSYWASEEAHIKMSKVAKARVARDPSLILRAVESATEWRAVPKNNQALRIKLRAAWVRRKERAHAKHES